MLVVLTWRIQMIGDSNENICKPLIISHSCSLERGCFWLEAVHVVWRECSTHFHLATVLCFFLCTPASINFNNYVLTLYTLAVHINVQTGFFQDYVFKQREEECWKKAWITPSWMLLHISKTQHGTGNITFCCLYGLSFPEAIFMAFRVVLVTQQNQISHRFHDFFVRHFSNLANENGTAKVIAWPG